MKKWRYWDITKEGRQVPVKDREALVMSRHRKGNFTFSKTVHGRDEHATWTIHLDAEQALHVAERIFEDLGIEIPQGIKYEEVGSG